ncbi:MAG TPA: hypothetical protein VFI42_16420 [Thermomicrobiaceae bacterium]|nr:hypothetical protein [Thermomicrobiaceae bacterium]
MTAQDAEIVRRGTFTAGALSVSYYTSNPAPTQWVAVGVVSGARMLVGTGPSEAAAIGDLAARYEQSQEDLLEADTKFATEWSF